VAALVLGCCPTGPPLPAPVPAQHQVKQVAEVVGHLAELCPHVVAGQAAMLQPYLGCEVHTVRSMVVSVLGQLLLQVMRTRAPRWLSCLSMTCAVGLSRAAKAAAAQNDRRNLLHQPVVPQPTSALAAGATVLGYPDLKA
jgi:hypothetical protein